MTFRFIHASDLHLGKPFGRFPEDVRVRLRQARAATLPRLAELAQAHGARHVLLAGDTFDQTTPAPTVIRQAMNAMRAAPDVVWCILPGNHDHTNATELWRAVARDAPDNLRLLTTPAPVSLAPGVSLLPAPPSERHPGRDLTDWFDSAETGEGIRLGLAHGSVTDFGGSEDGGSSVIAADRATRAGLAYLGLGDWHGCLRIGPRTWYSGAPEADSFKHSAAPCALLVEIAGQGSLPNITPLPTASLTWQSCDLTLTAGEDGPATLAAQLPPLAARASTLLSLRLSGRIPARDRLRVVRAVDAAAPDYLWHQSDLARLSALHGDADLDIIDQQGGLRAAAQTLAAEAGDPALSEHARAIAGAALTLLYSYAADPE